MARLAAAVIVLTTLIPTSLAHALCVQPTVQPHVVTADVTTSDGGVVIGTKIGYGGDGNTTEPEAQSWALKTKTGTVTVKPIALAPGLFVVKLPDKVDGGELLDGTTVVAKLARAAKPVPKLAAPAPRQIHHASTSNMRGSSERTTAVFAEGAVPAGAIALIVVDAKTKTPRSYGLVQAGTVEVAVYARGRCSALPNGTNPTIAGDKVILRWVDHTGAVSADSKTFTVATSK